MKSLYEAAVGDSVSVCGLLAKDYAKERMLALGITRGAKIEVLRRGPKNNLSVFVIRGAMIALRREEAEKILVT